jgi:putative hemolysin
MRRLDPAALDPIRTLGTLPPLIKGYLRLGGFVRDGAVIGEQFNTPMSASWLRRLFATTSTDWGQYRGHPLQR